MNQLAFCQAQVIITRHLRFVKVFLPLIVKKRKRCPRCFGIGGLVGLKIVKLLGTVQAQAVVDHVLIERHVKGALRFLLALAREAC